MGYTEPVGEGRVQPLTNDIAAQISAFVRQSHEIHQIGISLCLHSGWAVLSLNGHTGQKASENDGNECQKGESAIHCFVLHKRCILVKARLYAKCCASGKEFHRRRVGTSIGEREGRDQNEAAEIFAGRSRSAVALRQPQPEQGLLERAVAAVEPM